MICLKIACIQAQNFQISFTGSGLSTTIDSVQVVNLARDTSVTVKSSEGLHLVSSITDIETYLAGKVNLRIFPNPMNETSEIEFSNITECQINIEIFDATGKKIIHDKQNLIQGKHKYEISGLNPGIYLVNLITFDNRYNGKLLSTAENSGTPAIRYLDNNYSSPNKSGLKSMKSLFQMRYIEGEVLLLKAFSGNYSRVLTLLPTQNQTVNFEFIACQDAAGKHYPVVTIGTQTWMAENLALLPSVSSSSQGSQTTPLYYVYGYEGGNVTEAKATSNYQTYGVLYNWPAAKTVCPAGWHLPTDTEWTELENYLIANRYNYDGFNTGNKIGKSMATASGWGYAPKYGAIGNMDFPEKRNLSGFSCLPGGYRYYNGSFFWISQEGRWWSATEDVSGFAWSTSLHSFYVERRRFSYNKSFGFSVRCLRD